MLPWTREGAPQRGALIHTPTSTTRRTRPRGGGKTSGKPPRLSRSCRRSRAWRCATRRGGTAQLVRGLLAPIDEALLPRSLWSNSGEREAFPNGKWVGQACCHKSITKRHWAPSLLLDRSSPEEATGRHGCELIEIMSPLAGSSPAPGGHKSSDRIANQSADKKDAHQQIWCRQLHGRIPAGVNS